VAAVITTDLEFDILLLFIGLTLVLLVLVLLVLLALLAMLLLLLLVLSDDVSIGTGDDEDKFVVGNVEMISFVAFGGELD
jgi:hypothetical protein